MTWIWGKRQAQCWVISIYCHTYAGVKLIVRLRLERLGDSIESNSLLAVEQMFRNGLTTAAADHCQLFASLTKKACVSILLQPHLQKYSSLCAQMAGRFAELINQPSSTTKQMSLVWYFHSASIQGIHPTMDSARQTKLLTNTTQGKKFLGAVLDPLGSVNIFGKGTPTAVVSVTTLILTIGGALLINLWSTAHFVTPWTVHYCLILLKVVIATKPNI